MSPTARYGYVVALVALKLRTLPWMVLAWPPCASRVLETGGHMIGLDTRALY